MLKVGLFIDSDDPGGAETIIVEIAKRLSIHGIKPVVLHLGNPWLSRQCTKYSIEHIIVPGCRYYKSKYTLPLFVCIFAMFLKKNNIQVLHSHLFGAVTSGSLSAYLCRIKHIGTLHDTYTIENKLSRIYAIRLSIYLNTKIIVVSESMKRYFEKIGNIKAGTIKSINNGVDYAAYIQQSTPGTSTLSNITKGKYVFVCVARLVQLKRHDMLLAAFKVIANDSNVLLIVGNGPEKGRIEDMVLKLGLNKNVLFVGFRDDVPELLAGSNCFVLASETEGLSCSIQEAMAAGLPCIVTEVGGNSELILNNLNGFVVPSSDIQGFAAKMQLLMTNKDLSETFGQKSLAIIKEKFSLDFMVEKYVDLYVAGVN